MCGVSTCAPDWRIFDISIDLDYSWCLIVALLTWVLMISRYLNELKRDLSKS